MENPKVKSELHGLIETALAVNAETAHIVREQHEEHPSVTTVVSVYNGVKPSHVVLDELYKWAEEFNPIVVRKIDELMAATSRGGEKNG